MYCVIDFVVLRRSNIVVVGFFEYFLRKILNLVEKDNLLCMKVQMLVN